MNRLCISVGFVVGLLSRKLGQPRVLAGRKVINDMGNGEPADIGAFARAGSPENRRMVDAISGQLKLTTLKYQKLEDLVAAIGLPKERLCTHCWDGSSYF